MSSDPAFLLKALSETGGELQRALADAEFLDSYAVPADEDACLLQIAVHLRDCERAFLEQIESMLGSRRPQVRAIDTGAVPEVADCRRESVDRCVHQFGRLRKSTAYLLWELSDREWRRDAEHPYSGRITIADVVKAMHEHDLERLWQVSRIAGKLVAAEGPVR
jgi:hypothetical protein